MKTIVKTIAMKTSRNIFIIGLLVIINYMYSQTDTARVMPPDNLPGKNLNLYAVLDIFKSASSVQDFETKLNDPKSNVNNLDLNNDGKTDYLRVHEKGKKKNRQLIIQAVLGEKEIQDIAVINLSKTGDKLARVQVIGDEKLYGKNYIIEPKLDDTVSDTPKTQPSLGKATSSKNTYVTNNYYDNGPYGYYNVWYWPCVSVIFAPGYSYWYSPYYWGYYPIWWNPWPPIIYAQYVGYWGYRPYWRGYYRPTVVYGIGYRQYLRSYRTSSPMVSVNIKNNVYVVGRNKAAVVKGNSWGGFYNRKTNAPANRNQLITHHANAISSGRKNASQQKIAPTKWGGFGNSNFNRNKPDNFKNSNNAGFSPKPHEFNNNGFQKSPNGNGGFGGFHGGGFQGGGGFGKHR